MAHVTSGRSDWVYCAVARFCARTDELSNLAEGISMSSKHLFLVAAAFAAPLIACGGSSDSEEPMIVPKGDHHTYVVSHAFVPTTTDQAQSYGLDLGTKTSSKKLDGSVDNGLGLFLSLVQGILMQNGGTPQIDIQASVNKAVDQGTVNLLIDFQTEDFTTSDAAGFSVKLGASSSPPACTDATDTACRHQLDGNATFTLAANSPTDALVAGKIVSGSFVGGPGDVSVSISFGGTPVTLDLLHARVRASGISDTGITSAIIGGMIVQKQLLQQIAPVVLPLAQDYLATNCTAPNPTPPTCGCTTMAGKTLITLVGADGDCAVTADGIANSAELSALVGVDVCSTDSCSTADAVSLGIKVDAVKATIAQ